MILVINSGSSSIKFRLYSPSLAELAGGIVERVGLADSFMEWRAGKDEKKRKEYPAGVADHAAGLREALAALAGEGFAAADITAVGHRVVHGGEEFVAPTFVDAGVLRKLEAYNRLAPLHNPPNLAGIASVLELLPQARNVAVFDTAFYRTMKPDAYLYSIPREYYERFKIRKYGFHGISHAYVAQEAAKTLKKPLGKLRLVSCHIGSGASVTAVRNGKAMDTSMGFTPLEGLTMSTRCGDLDPAVPLYMMRALGLTEEKVDDILNKQSGMLGLTGYKDMRDTLARTGWRVPGIRQVPPKDAEERKWCRFGVDVFCYDVARYIGQFAALMGGADAVIFTAGVGERSQFLCDRIMGLIKLPGDPKVLVVPTNEELMIAQETRKAMKQVSNRPPSA